jgi:hypothetical protein
MSNIAHTAKSWRNVFKVHPACELFPLPPDQLRALGEDIKANGLRETIKFVRYHRSAGQYDSRRGEDGDTDLILIDGRNRLDAMELVGESVPTTVEEIEYHISDFEEIEVKNDEEIVRYIISANIRRRHLSGKDQDRIIGELLKLDPYKSDRQIGRETNVDHKKVGAVRHQMEDVGEIPHVERRIDTKGRQQLARPRQPAAPLRPPEPSPEPAAAPEQAESEQPATSITNPDEPPRLALFIMGAAYIRSWIVGLIAAANTPPGILGQMVRTMSPYQRKDVLKEADRGVAAAKTWRDAVKEEILREEVSKLSPEDDEGAVQMRAVINEAVPLRPDDDEEGAS